MRRPPQGLLAGMWSFPEGEAGGGDPLLQAADIASGLGVEVERGAQAVALEPVRHQFTHLRATYQPVLLRCKAGAPRPESIWRLPTDFGELALPVAQQKIAKQVAGALNAD